MTLRARAATVALILSGTAGCDQATKQIAVAALKGQPGFTFLGDTIRVRYAENQGAFLSLGASLPEAARLWILTVGVGILLLGILAWALFSRELRQAHVVGAALVAGGGLSNWVDRAARGYVVDFLNLGIGSLRTGVFNVADVAIMAGVALLAFWPREPRKATP